MHGRFEFEGGLGYLKIWKHEKRIGERVARFRQVNKDRPNVHHDAIELVNGDVVLVKVCKPTQDTRFDLPAVGPGTIRALAEVRGRALAVEAGRTITLDRAEMIALADAHEIAIVAVDPGECMAGPRP